ncbi:hypothetical protein VNO77_43966 [Canavalia gladiata]|uniref:Uncharacterized protein n=1 Tax=Canavalia gladiata TaxID=3824 RepID=A0AAN9PND3_CANGL
MSQKQLKSNSYHPWTASRTRFHVKLDLWLGQSDFLLPPLASTILTQKRSPKRLLAIFLTNPFSPLVLSERILQRFFPQSRSCSGSPYL